MKSEPSEVPTLPLPSIRTAATGCRAWVGTLAAVLVASGGCASRHYGSEQQVIVRSEPPGAAVYVGDRYAGVTPVEVTLAGGPTAPRLRLRKEGYEPEDVKVCRTVSKLLWANLGLAMYVRIASSHSDGLSRADHARTFGLVTASATGADLLTGAALRLPRTIRPTLRRRPIRPRPVPEGIVVPSRGPDAMLEGAIWDALRQERDGTCDD